MKSTKCARQGATERRPVNNNGGGKYRSSSGDGSNGKIDWSDTLISKGYTTNRHSAARETDVLPAGTSDRRGANLAITRKGGRRCDSIANLSQTTFLVGGGKGGDLKLPASL